MFFIYTPGIEANKGFLKTYDWRKIGLYKPKRTVESTPMIEAQYDCINIFD